MPKRTEAVNPNIFERETVECCTCESEPNEATHVVTISVDKGIDFRQRTELYRVTYSVCGACARTLVEVKLDAQLLRRGRS